VLESVENDTAKMSPDEQIESNEESKDIISNNKDEAMNSRMHNRDAETVTNVYKDACRLFP